MDLEWRTVLETVWVRAVTALELCIPLFRSFGDFTAVTMQSSNLI